MAESSEETSRQVKERVDHVCSSMSAELLAALSEAAEDDDRWTEAGRDVGAYLEERRIEMPPDTQISLLRAYPQPASSCPPGYLKVCRLGPDRRVTVLSVKLCTWAPHVGTVCIEVPLRSEVVPGVYDCYCVPIETLAAGPRI
jgi:hypothetical protein